MDTSLTLRNPEWAARVAADAKEYTAAGHFSEWMEFNGNFGNDPEVLAFIEANRN